MRYRSWIFIASGIFVIGLGAGLIISAIMPADIVGFISQELSSLEELSATFGPFQLKTAVFIFFRNASVLLLSFLLSPLLCLIPVMALGFNGLFISFISVIVTRQESLGFLLAGILPHGIFEIPALIMGEAAALSTGVMIIAAAFSKEKRGLLPAKLKQNFKYLVLAFILLVPAAIIETYVTPLLLQ